MSYCQRMLKGTLAAILAVITVIISPSTSRAETTEDLFEIYGVDLGGVARPKIDEAAARVQMEIDKANEQQRANNWVNSAIDSSLLQYETKKNEINGKVSVMMQTNLKLIHSMESGIYGDIDDLIAADSAYKSNTVKINDVLKELDTYSTIERLNNIDVDIDAIMSEYNDIVAQYKIAVDVYELGDVNNVPFPMNRERAITSEFGNRIDPLNPGTYGYHSGLDLRAETGTEVYSLFHGVVSGCGWSDTVGYWVRVEHGKNVRSFYCHLSELCCTEGQEVNQGDLIAKSGSTGTRCTGPHLHLGLYINGSAVDPNLLFR